MGLKSFFSDAWDDYGQPICDPGDFLSDLTGRTGANAARDAANTQAKSASDALALQREMYEKNISLNEPWRQAGIGALGDLATGLKSGEFESPDAEFDYSMQDPNFDFKFEADPGYQFRQQQQQQAIERSAAAGGGLFSGATLADLASRSGKMASEEYGKAYDRAYGGYRDQVGDAINKRNFAYGNFSDAQARKKQNLQERFSRLSTLAGFGEGSASRTGAAATTFGDRASSSIMDIGNAQAAGRVGAANAQQEGTMGIAKLATSFFGGR